METKRSLIFCAVMLLLTIFGFFTIDNISNAHVLPVAKKIYQSDGGAYENDRDSINTNMMMTNSKKLYSSLETTVDGSISSNFPVVHIEKIYQFASTNKKDALSTVLQKKKDRRKDNKQKNDKKENSNDDGSDDDNSGKSKKDGNSDDDGDGDSDDEIEKDDNGSNDNASADDKDDGGSGNDSDSNDRSSDDDSDSDDRSNDDDDSDDDSKDDDESSDDDGNANIDKGSISGRVVDNNNQPIVGISVHATSYKRDDFGYSATTDTNGNYIIKLPAGSYRVRTQTIDTNFVDEYYDNVFDSFKATPVHVTRLSNIPNIDFMLEAGGSISGRVVDADNQPISGVSVDAINNKIGVSGGSALTDINGNYRINGLPNGNYKVQTNTNDTNFIDEYYDDVLGLNRVTLVRVIQLNNTPNIDFILEVGGSISGRVVNENNEPIAGVNIATRNLDVVGSESSALTDANGYYAIVGLSSGIYKVWTDAIDTNLADEYYNNAIGFSLATPVQVTQPDNTPNIDFMLEVGGSISGRITNQNNQPVVGIKVDAINLNGSVHHSAITDKNGNYTINRLPTDSYGVRTDASGTNLVDEYYIDDPSFPFRKSIQVTQPNDTPNIDFILETGGSISGRVVDADNHPIARVDVFVLNEEGILIQLFASTTTDENGDYIIDRLPTTNYIVHAQSSIPNFFDEVYDNVTEPNMATRVQVTQPNDTPNIDFILEKAGSISGRVVDVNNNPIVGIHVNAINNETGFGKSAITDENGDYIIKRLRTGNYRVRTSSFNTNFTAEYYDNVVNPDLATAVSVTQPNDTPNIDFVLGVPGVLGSISGRVVDSDNQPIVGVHVSAANYNGGNFDDSAITDTNGNYTIENLPAGNYRVRTQANDTNLVDKFYDNVVDFDQALPVLVTQSNNTPNIDFMLESSGSISGKVLDGNNQPVVGSFVLASNIDTVGVARSATTDANGEYTIDRLPAGNYRVRTQANDTNLVDKFYDNVFGTSLATAVQVTQHNNTTGIDFVLEVGGSISGRVLDENNEPIVGILVGASNIDGISFGSSAETDKNGDYVIKRLPTGSYNVRTIAFGTNFINEFYDNVVNANLATPVSVIQPNTTLDINFFLGASNSVTTTTTVTTTLQIQLRLH